MLQRDEVGVGDVVALLGEVRRDVPTGLAAATGEEDAHDPTVPAKVLVQSPPTRFSMSPHLLGRADRSRASLPTPGYMAILDAVAEIDPDFDCGAIMAQFSTGA